MARPEIYKTLLGERLAFARKAIGHSERKTFADLLGIKADTLGTYERGVSEPDIALLTKYHELFAVNITWLITGEGFAFSDPRRGPTLGPANLNVPPSSTALHDAAVQPLPTDLAPEENATGFKISQREDMLAEIGELLDRLHKDAFITLRTKDRDRMVARFYNQFLASDPDLKDEEETRLWLKLVEKQLRRSIATAVAEPGTGKRSAS